MELLLLMSCDDDDYKLWLKSSSSSISKLGSIGVDSSYNSFY